MKTKSIVVLLGAFIFLTSWKQIITNDSSNMEPGKIKVMILYPHEEGKTFDMDYYSKKHMPMVAGLFGEFLKSYGIDKGISGRTPEEPLPYVAIGYF